MPGSVGTFGMCSAPIAGDQEPRDVLVALPAGDVPAVLVRVPPRAGHLDAEADVLAQAYVSVTRRR